MRVLDGGFGVDVDDGGLDGLGNAIEIVVMQMDGGNAELRRITAVHVVGAGRVGEDGADDQHQGHGDGSNEKRGETISRTVCHRSLRLICCGWPFCGWFSGDPPASFSGSMCPPA